MKPERKAYWIKRLDEAETRWIEKWENAFDHAINQHNLHNIEGEIRWIIARQFAEKRLAKIKKLRQELEAQ